MADEEEKFFSLWTEQCYHDGCVVKCAGLYCCNVLLMFIEYMSVN